MLELLVGMILYGMLTIDVNIRIMTQAGRVLYTRPALTTNLPSLEERPMAASDHTARRTHVQLELVFGGDDEDETGKGTECRLTRSCPACGQVLRYGCETYRNAAAKANKICQPCTYARRAKAYTGTGNPFYGRKHSEATLDRFRAREHPHTQTAEFRQGASVRFTARNPMTGSSVYKRWIEKHGKEKADELMESFREKTSRASSGEE